MVTYRPGYVTIIDLLDNRVDLCLPENMTCLSKVVCADIEVSLYMFKTVMYVLIGDKFWVRIKPETWETKDSPVRFIVELFDRAGRQYIRFVIHMDKGYKKAGAFFVEQRDGQNFITPVTDIHRRVIELRKQNFVTKSVAKPYKPRLEKYSAIGKSKEYFYNSSANPSEPGSSTNVATAFDKPV